VDLPEEEAAEAGAEVRVVVDRAGAEVRAVAVLHDPAEVLAAVDQEPANATI
jgi:predicted secreted protein